MIKQSDLDKARESIGKSNSSLDDVFSNLDNPKTQTIRKSVSLPRQSVKEYSHDWQSDAISTKPKLVASFVSPFVFWISSFGIIFLIGALIFSYVKSREKNSINDSIIITIESKTSIDGGEDIGLVTKILNNNDVPLELADLVISYKTSSDSKAENKIIRKNLDQIPKTHELTVDDIPLVLFGKEGEKKKITATLEYRVLGSTSIFTKEQTHEITILSSPILVTTTLPKTVTANQKLSFSINLARNETTSIAVDPKKSLFVKVIYPKTFDFHSALPAPKYGSAVWEIKKEDDPIITIDGELNNNPGEFSSFDIEVGYVNEQNPREMDVTLAKESYLLEVKNSFIEFKALVNNKKAEPTLLSSEESVATVELSWKNLLKEPISNMIIIANIEGEGLDTKKIIEQTGYFDDATQSIRWTSDQNPEFKFVAPNASGTISVQIPFLDSEALADLKTPQASVSFSVSGTDLGGKKLFVENAIKRTMSVVSKPVSSAVATRKELPFAARGSFPFAQGTATNYGLRLSIQNATSDLEYLSFKTKLPQYLEYKGIFSPTNAKVSFDAITRTLSWDVRSLKALAKTETIIELSLVPSLAQLQNAEIPLSGLITFEAKDVTLNRNIRQNLRPATSRTLVESTFGKNPEETEKKN
jgi:hypothetical protein